MRGHVSWLNELSTRHVIRSQGGGVDRNFGQMLCFALSIGQQAQFARALFDDVDQLSCHRTLHARPIGDFVDDSFSMLAEKVIGWTDAPALLRYIKNIYQIGI